MEETTGTAIAGEGAAHFFGMDELLEDGAAGFFFVVVGAEVEGYPVEAIHCGEFAVEGIGATAAEPAVGSGRSSGERYALLPGFVENGVEVPGAPEGEHVVG